MTMVRMRVGAWVYSCVGGVRGRAPCPRGVVRTILVGRWVGPPGWRPHRDAYCDCEARLV
jgi:hypothetical protein